VAEGSGRLEVICQSEDKNPVLFRFLLVAALLAGITLPSNSWGSDLKPQSRLAIVRGLTAEYATLKVPLPRGRKGISLSARGQVDEESLKREIIQNGTALRPNVLVQITQITFQEKEIIFEINGGGRHKSKWYDHVEVGMDPNMTVPLNQGAATTPTGSSITLIFPQKLQDLTVEELKNYLGPALDFNPVNPLQALTRPIPPQFSEAVKAGKAAVGMDRDTVLAAMGQPQRKVREVKDGAEREDWIYGAPPLKVTFVTFEEDEVVNVQEYEGGIGGQVQATSEPEDPTPR
jgi:hypothetical protein